jgi:protocatechuate 3,4-dioxygenase beta subunit
MVWAAVLVAVTLSGAEGQAPPPPPPPPVGYQGPVRDPGRPLPPEPVGTGTIRGRVVAADTGSPIKRAQVNLSAVPPPAPPAGAARSADPVSGSIISTGDQLFINGQPMIRSKSVTTDAQGAFEFRQLPAGTYRISASPGQYSAGYLGIVFGAKSPNGPGGVFDPGTPITLGDGQTFDKATIGLPRGAVITGRVIDEDGQPLARVQVYGAVYLPGSSRANRTGSGAQTDDLGQFRMFGLPPGDYMVAAEARPNTFVPPNAPPETEDDKIGFMTTYYPGTGDEAAAQRVRAKAGAETPGVEIRMVSGRLYHVTGMVTDSQGRTPMRASVSLLKRTQAGGVTSFGFSTDAQGQFQMRNVPPGTYRLTARQQPIGPAGEMGEFASIPLTVNSDLDNILITTAPGATITGNVVFESGPPQLPPGQSSLQLRVMAASGDPETSMGAPMPQPALVSPDLTFTMKGMAGELLLRSSAPGNYLKAVQIGGEDIIDTPREFKNGDRVTLVLTSRAATVEGNVTDASGKPAPQVGVILFSDDKANWRSSSIRTHRAGTDANGHFRLAGLLSGSYFIVALPRERLNGLTLGSDPSVYEALSKEATTLVVGDDEQRQVDLKISAGGGL